MFKVTDLVSLNFVFKTIQAIQKANIVSNMYILCPKSKEILKFDAKHPVVMTILAIIVQNINTLCQIMKGEFALKEIKLIFGMFDIDFFLTPT